MSIYKGVNIYLSDMESFLSYQEYFRIIREIRDLIVEQTTW